ncbi:ATP-grasp fold amidoligase family protein [Carnobacterium mobile]|uniref:ATP-grasp fold amidoligase family protein n=1 Tax=Carnobacterium mobile TaxID=2750 RepID=UPI000A042220|nr:ATP-grasp fold amidoligase family protein [Carnobacterium mobile]
MKVFLKKHFSILFRIRNGIISRKSYLYLKNLTPNKYKLNIEEEYKKKTGFDLNLDNPKTYTEKMQWAKLYENTPLKTELTDKHLVREWVKQKIGSEYLIPIYGVWEKFEDIEFDKLPNSFVLKANHASGWNIVVKNKVNFEYNLAKKKFNKWIKKNYAYIYGLQLHYKNIKPLIVCEKYIEDSNGELVDYKFMCFDGKVYYCWVDVGRFEDHRRNVYNTQWELQPWIQHNYKNTDYTIEKPKNFEKMLEIAEKLCQNFSHVRVDLYNVDDKIYFGEMTFTNGSGYELIYPNKYNYMLGNLWKLPLKHSRNE